MFRNSGVDGPPGVVLSDEEGSVADGEEEEDDDSGLQVHEALLHKDFITNKFTVAFKFYEKVIIQGLLLPKCYFSLVDWNFTVKKHNFKVQELSLEAAVTAVNLYA